MSIEGDIQDLLLALNEKQPSRANPAGLPCPVCGEKTLKTKPLAWKCPSCLAGGTALEWISLRDGVGLRDAVKKLAEHVEKTRPSWCDVPEETLGAAMATAQRFFLEHVDEAKKQLARREAPTEALVNGAMGWCPFGPETVKRLDAPGSREGGLLNDKGLPHLAGRVTIPLHDVEGRLVAFKGWLPPGRKGLKYLDTKSTPLYRRCRVVYNFHRAINAIREKGFGVLVEGVFDCWALVSIGVPNVVAALTCAISQEQAAILKGAADRWTIAMDGNQAGREGAEKIASLLGPNTKIARLPDDMDPDEIVRKGGACVLREMVV